MNTVHPLFTKSAVFLAFLSSSTFTNAAQSSPEEETEIERVKVIGYHKEDASSLLRNGLSLKEIPRTVDIFSSETIQELKPAAIEDVLRFSANTTFLGPSDGRSNAFSIHGFQDAPILRDGFRVETFGGITDPELFNLEQIEVLKGPDSILYGESNPSGIINMRAKRPKNESHTEIQVDARNFGLFYPKVDHGGTIGDNLSYRVVGVYFKEYTFRGYDNSNERTFIAPTLRWDISDYTSITFIAEFTNDDFQADFGSLINENAEFIAPIGQVNNHPVDTIERHQYTYGFDASHNLNENWQINARFRDFDAGYQYSALFLPFRFNFTTNEYTRVAAQQSQQNDERALQLNASGDFVVAGLRNRLVVGIDARDTDQVNITRFDPSVQSILDWLDPDYSELPPPADDLPLFPTQQDNVERLGIFAQNHLNISDELVLSLGIRRDDVKRNPLADSTSTAQDLNNTGLQFGLTYAISPHYSAFFSYSESFLPNFETDRNNNVIDPEQGEGYEIGIKGFELADNVSFTASYFDITKRNVAMADLGAGPDDPNPFGSIASGQQKSNGFEFEMHGKFTERLTFDGNLGYTNSEDMGQEDIQGAADFTASVWTSFAAYEQNDLSIVVGGGINYVGERLAIRDPNGDGDIADAV